MTRPHDDPLATPHGPGISTPDSALVIVAHADDAEFLCGATLAGWAREGCTIHYLVLTDGSKGTWDPGIDTSELVALREEEQHRAAAVLGATGEIAFLHRTDGDLAADRDTVAAVALRIRRLRPAVVLAHDPWRRYRLHPDHEAAGRVAVHAIVGARDPFFFPEQLEDGLEPHRPEVLLLFEADEVNHLEVVAEVDLVAKFEALEVFESQMETTHFYQLDPDTTREAALGAFRDRERARVTDVPGAPEGALAEPFHLISSQL